MVFITFLENIFFDVSTIRLTVCICVGIDHKLKILVVKCLYVLMVGLFGFFCVTDK